MEVLVGISKIKKYATSESGDTVEVVERPNGGLSIVLADGQSSGKGAKWISTLVVRKVITLLAEGVRDGAAARAASDSLYTERGGKVSATLNILSIDNQTRTLVITRNNPAAVLLAKHDSVICLDEPSIPIGLYRGTRPLITEVPLEPGITSVTYSDGLIHAGSRYGESMDVPTNLQALLDEEEPRPQFISDSILEHALKLDRGRPSDDISVVVLRVTGRESDEVRRMSVRLPLDII
jgi:serine phosphatase RsbU (regulator of sigma subunit)